MRYPRRSSNTLECVAMKYVFSSSRGTHELPQQLGVEMYLRLLDADDRSLVHHQRAAHDDEFVDAGAIMGEWEADAVDFR